MSIGPSQIEEAESFVKQGKYDEAAKLYEAIIAQEVKPGTGDALLKDKENALLGLGQVCVKKQDAQALAKVVTNSRQVTAAGIAKAKTAKLIRSLIDLFEDIPDTDAVKSSQIQIDVTKDSTKWARESARIFLAQSLETRLVSLYFDAGNFKQALSLIDALLRELKKLDDKMILTEVHLLESRVNHALSNFTKSKAALTSARTAANAIYCPPLLQASLDMQSGVLLAEEKDYKTAYSYFFETLESYAAQDDKRAVLALKYMLLCKIMLNLSEDVQAIVSGKLASRFTGPDIQAMLAVAKAHSNRSLEEFDTALATYKNQLSDDPIIRNHLASLYDTLLEQNLVRVIEPYSKVEIQYVAESVKLPIRDVEAKLSQMILDKVFHGILDQGAGCLIVYEEPEEDKTYDATLETLRTVGEVVDSLYAKAITLP